METKRQIPMLDLKAEFIEVEDEITSAVTTVLKSAQYILGQNGKALEETVARYNGCAHGSALASGTDALLLSLVALGIGEGDEVITTPFTFFATIEAIVMTGARPVFVDIDEETMNMDASMIESKITKKTKAIIPVHLFGMPIEMDRIMSIAERYKLRVIEDCAQSFGASINGRMTGSFGDTGCFSFYPSKNLGCCGDGGMVITNDKVIKDSIDSLRNHGATKSYVHDVIGYNSRLDEIQAAILLIKIRLLDRNNRRRRENALLYNTLLKDSIRCPVFVDGYECTFHQYTIRTPERDRLMNRLAENGVSSVVYYPIPMHLQRPVHKYGYKEGSLPVSEKAAKEVLSLPIHSGLTPEDIEYVAKIICGA